MKLEMSSKKGGGKKKQAKKHKQVAFKDDWQLEAQVNTSLPPLVEGVLRGYVRVCVEGVMWEYSIGPPAPKLCIRLKWWGEQSSGTIFRVPVQMQTHTEPPRRDCTTLAFYPVYSGWPQLQAYLKDMGSLLFQIGLGHMTDDSTMIGQAVVTNLSGLSATNPIKGQYPIVNSNGVNFGKLRVRVCLEPSLISEKQKDMVGTHSDFVVGPGVKPNKDGSQSSSPEEDISTIIGCLNSGERMDVQVETTGDYTQPTSGSYTKPPIHIPTSGTAATETGSQSLQGGDSGSSTVQQIEVISELIARGRKLRDAMVHSVLEPQGTFPGREGNKTWPPGGDQRELPFSGSLPLLSMELNQKQKSVHKGDERVQKSSHTGVTRKEERFGSSLEAGEPLLDSRDQEVLELVLRSTREPELDLDGVYVELTSEEEEEGGGMGDECSMNESDYPLYNDSLLHNLLYDDPGQLEATAERTGMIASVLEDPGNMRREEGAVEGLKKSVDGPSSVSEQHERDPFQQNLPRTEDFCSKLPETGSHSKTHSGSSSTAGGTLVPTILPGKLSSVTIPSKQTGSRQCQVSETLSSELEPGKTDSLSTLSSFMGRHDRSLETAILRLIGMEKLTKLGRVNSARVKIEHLQVDHSAVQSIYAVQKTKKRIAAGAPLPELSCASATYFVEYQFPAIVHKPHPGRPNLLPSREIMRIASKKTKGGIVSFSHRSMFPVMFNSHVIQQWWNSSLVFRVYCRPPSERMPFLLGKAVVPFQRWLVAPSFSFQCQLDIRSSTLARGVSEVDPTIGKLEVALQLVVGRKQQQEEMELPKKDPSPVEDEEERREVPLQEEENQQTVKLREKAFSPTIVHTDTTHAKNKPPALQLLLLVPEGTNIITPSTHQRDPIVEHATTTTTAAGKVGSVPNCYLVCKLFCATPHPKTPVQWASPNPPFGFKQIYPLYLTPSLLDQVCNNFTVIEVWHKTPGTTTEDDLIGLVKLSLHQFYLAYSEESSADLCQEAELPVVAVDCYCPIVSPFTGAQQGHLAVLLALGTSNQVSLLQQQFARGSYLLQRPHQSPRSRGAMTEKAGAGLVVPRGLHQLEAGERQDDTGGSMQHVFEVTVDGVRGLSVFSSTVWGEADCFVQYHFPTTGERGEEEDPEVFLHPYRTTTTLCMPNPAFNHKTCHAFLLPQTCPLQRELMGVCGSGGVPFELWRRFYYPNIRDQLVAKASLPLAKLCAMVTMQRTALPSIQSFSLPLKLVSEDRKAESGGLLDVTVKYEALSEGNGETEEELSQQKTHVNLSIGILRATGLKDAALLAANDHPVPLGFAAEVGVNTYVKIIIPSALHEEKRSTKTIARCFAPDYFHFFDLALPLLQVQDDRLHQAKGHKCTASKSKSEVSLAEELARGSLVLEIWHQVPRKGARTGPTEARVFGRHLGPVFRDILLGYVEIPMVQLLQKHTGVRGWFPLCPPKNPYDGDQESASDAASPHTPPLEEYVGGVELSVFFTNKEDRKMILSNALKMGWKAPESCGIDLPSLVPVSHTRKEVTSVRKVGCGVGEGEGWRLDLNVNNLWVPLDAVAIPVPTATNPTYKYCFIRYHFMDNSPVVTAPHAVTYARDGTAYYQLNHRAQLHTLASAQLQWYLNEESLEIQVWGSVMSGWKKSEAEGRPRAEDRLLGLAYVPLGELLGHSDRSGPQISGCYPIFKPGVDSLGGQALQVEIRRVVLEATEKAERGEVEILDSSTDEDERGDYTPSTSRQETGPEEKTTGALASEQPPPVKEEEAFRDVFEARMVVHQALHLPLLTDCQQPESDWPPSAYVKVHPHASVDKITTPVVPGNQRPVWEYQCVTLVPNLYLESQCPGLEFQVWSKRPDGKCPQPQDGGQAEGGDDYLGSAHIDISPLAYGLSQISGWYNIADFGGQIQGQLKVTVIPSQRISFPSPMLSYPAHITSLVGKPTEFIAPNIHNSGLSHQHHTATEGHALDLERLKPTQTDQLSSKTTSVLFRQLRDNIQELDKIHESLQAKLQDSEDWNESSIPERRQSYAPQLSSTPPGANQLTNIAGDLQAEGDGTEVTSREAHAPDEQAHVTDGNRRRVIPNTSDASSVSSSHLPAMQHGHIEPPVIQTSSTEIPDQSAPFELLPSSHDGRGVPLQSNSPSTDQPSTSGGVSPILMPESSSVGSNSPDSSVVTSSHNETVSLTDVSAYSLELSQPAASTSDQHLQFAHSKEEGEGLGDRSPEHQQQSREQSAEIPQASPKTSDLSFSEESPTPKASESSQVDNSSHLDHSPLAPHTEDHRVKELSTLCAEKATATHFVVDPCKEKEKGGLRSRTSVLLVSPSLQTPGGNTATDAFSAKPNGDRGSSQVETASRETHVQQHAQRRMPRLVSPGIHFPNFFMPPHELEQSMRSLRASVLSRPPPRRQATDRESALDSHVSTKQGFRTLREVNRYLDSQRTGDAAREISASQTQRIARIFSSKPAHIH